MDDSVRALDVRLNSGTRFEDLPQDLRDLARLLFVKNGPIYVVELGHFMKCRNCPKTYDGLSDNLKNMINEIYFPENLFHFDNQSRLHSLLSNRKESRNMRRVGVDLKNLDNAVPSLRTFARDLGLLQQLRELEIGVNEAQMVQAMCQADPGYSAVLMRPQDIPGTMNKLVLRMRGLKHLQRTLVPKVSFTGWIHKDNPEPYYSRCTGPIPGGVLETIVASSMMRQSKAGNLRPNNQYISANGILKLRRGEKHRSGKHLQVLMTTNRVELYYLKGQP
ncbi:hypothetical protein SLS60_008106 [Paraconiothyrium brasiliense]|uniref:Uncharacterized protein n=1 Tax=Paraconiothyrium brasiliense TaxID=300254 RepID=A0ABR3R3H2_9PLEO